MKIKTMAALVATAPAIALVPMAAAHATGHASAACYPPKPHRIDFSASTNVVTHRGEKVRLFGRVHGCGRSHIPVKIKCSSGGHPHQQKVEADGGGRFHGHIRVYHTTTCAATLLHRDGGDSSRDIKIYRHHHHH